MTKEQFDSYKFSVSTQAKYHGEWNLINEVDFREGWIGLKESGYYLRIEEIEDIRN